MPVCPLRSIRFDNTEQMRGGAVGGGLRAKGKIASAVSSDGNADTVRARIASKFSCETIYMLLI